MKPIDSPFYSIIVKIALFILILSIILIFYVTPGSAEFYVCLMTIILMAGFVLLATFQIRRGRSHEHKKD